MANVYQNPTSDLGVVTNFSFSNLGIWRKIYIFLNWFFPILMCLFLLIAPFSFGGGAEGSSTGGVSMGRVLTLLVMSVVLLGYAYWVHYAVCTRNLTQLTVLAIINLFPFLNPIAMIVLFAIRSTSKKEMEATSAH